MHNSLRFTQLEKQRRRAAQKVLNDPNAPPAQKLAARQQIDEVFKSAQGRRDSRFMKRALGPSPQRADFATSQAFEEALVIWQRRIDEVQCTQILNDPASSFPKRERARKRLEMMPTVVKKGLDREPIIKRVKHDWRPPGEKERALAFLDELSKEATHARRVSESV